MAEQGEEEEEDKEQKKKGDQDDNERVIKPIVLFQFACNDDRERREGGRGEKNATKTMMKV